MSQIRRKFFKVFVVLLFAFGAFSMIYGQADNGPINIKISNNTSGVILLDQNETGMTVRMDVGTIELIPVNTKGGVFVLPRIDGFSRSFKDGEPTLPVINKLIAMPYGATLSYQILDSKTKDVKLSDYYINLPFMPVQPSLRKSDDYTKVPFVYNKDKYKLTKYALPLIDAKRSGIMRDTTIGQIAFSPIEYNPVGNTIKVYSTLTVRINYVNGDLTKTKAMKKKYGSYLFDTVNNHLLNYDPYVADVKADLQKYPIKYLIISDRMFESQLAPFIAWKTKKGFKVVVGYTDTIGTTTTAIKAYIKSVYDAGTASDPAPSFVLFVGDVQQIPAFAGTAGSHITDHTYCEFTGDNYPEIYYGRFSAQTTTELQPQIDKTLEYEQWTNLDHTYMANCVLVSGVDSSYAQTYGNGAINYGTNYYFNTAHGFTSTVWLYPASAGSTADASILTTVSNGVGYYHYTAHSSHDGPSDPHFLKTDIASISNNHKYFLGIGNSCQSNTFGSDYSTPAFGEAIMQVANKGAIGWIGASNYTYWDEDYWWAVGNATVSESGPTYAASGIGQMDGVFHDHGEAVSLHYTTNGSMLFAGSMAVSEAGSSRIKYYWEEYHLMGDPSVMTYMAIPTTNTVTHPSSLSTSATSATVTAAAGSYVGITKGGVLYGAGYVTTSGSVTITLTPFGSSGTADIVVTCQNKIPYVSTISVVSGNVPPVANFTGTPTSGIAPLTVNFTDTSTEGPTSWSWNFGDGGTSTLQNPSHQYTATGTYTVQLTATNAYGSNSVTKTGYITVSTLQAPVAAFTASATTVTVGGSVTFTDQSTNSPTSWSWTFPGGTPSTSTAQNPTVTYSTAGTYSVTLTATNAAGNNTLTRTNYITVSGVSYCASQSTDYSDEYIKTVKIGSMTNTSAGSYYTDYTSISASMTRGASVSIKLTPGFTGSSFTEYWKVWIDYNKDGDFLDTGEQVYKSIENSMEEYYKNIFGSIAEDKREQVLESLQLLTEAVKDNKCSEKTK